MASQAWRSQGCKVKEATWDMTLPETKLSTEADKMRKERFEIVF